MEAGNIMRKMSSKKSAQPSHSGHLAGGLGENPQAVPMIRSQEEVIAKLNVCTRWYDFSDEKADLVGKVVISRCRIV